METKIAAKRVENLQNQIGFAGCYAIDSDGLSGGVGLFWSTEVEVEIKNYSSCHIDCIVKMRNKQWRFTGFYGAPELNTVTKVGGF
jgi:hypothetical protein